MSWRKAHRLVIAASFVATGALGCQASLRTGTRVPGPGAMVVSSPVHTEEEAPYVRFDTQREYGEVRMRALGGGPVPSLELERPSSPAEFVARAEQRIATLEREVQNEAFLGNVSNEALLIVRARGRAVVAAARAAARDGTITERERDQIRTLLRDAETEALGAVPMHRAWTGGWRYWR